MGWKGTVRSFGATLRAIERETQRMQHAAERDRRIAMKEAEIAAAADAVYDWEELIEYLQSVPDSQADSIDWEEIAAQPKPAEPVPGTLHQTKAEKALADFKPGFLDAFRGGSHKRRTKIENAITDAIAKDKTDYERENALCRNALEEWEADTKFARRLISGEALAINEVIEESKDLFRGERAGTQIRFSIDDSFLHAIPQVHSEEIVPKFRRKQLASGKLSETAMPVGQFNELYQDYVCSVALRVADDLFNILPLEEIYVTCRTSMLNQQTGHMEPTPILSVKFVRSTFVDLDLTGVDPSSAMKNFKNEMRFKKTAGFAAVEPLVPVD